MTDKPDALAPKMRKAAADLDEAIGALDKQTYAEHRRADWDMPDDAELVDLTLTAKQQRSIGKAYHALVEAADALGRASAAPPPERTPEGYRIDTAARVLKAKEGPFEEVPAGVDLVDWLSAPPPAEGDDADWLTHVAKSLRNDEHIAPVEEERMYRIAALLRAAPAGREGWRPIGWVVIGDNYSPHYLEAKSDAEYRARTALVSGAANVTVAEAHVRLAASPTQEDGRG